MAIETILQHEVLAKFAYPFLLIFFIVFAVLEKTKILGDDKHQINALVAFVIGLIFVGALQPKIIVSNLILFLTVALIVMFVGVILFAVFLATLLAMGIWAEFFDLLFNQPWSRSFWTNFVFIIVVVVALAVILKTAGKSGK